MDSDFSPRPRVQLKHTLRLERQRLYGKRFLPECAFCGKGIESAPDMNEVLFTKGDISGVEHLAALIDHRCNCVLVHPGGNTSKCHAGAHTKQGQKTVIRHLITWESGEDLLEYVNMMKAFMKGYQYEHAYNLIQEVLSEMQGV